MELTFTHAKMHLWILHACRIFLLEQFFDVSLPLDELSTCLFCLMLMQACFMSAGRLFVRIFAVESATVLMHVKQSSFDFCSNICFAFFVLRKLLSNTLHCLSVRTSWAVDSSAVCGFVQWINPDFCEALAWKRDLCAPVLQVVDRVKTISGGFRFTTEFRF